MVGRGQPDGNGVSSFRCMRLRTHLGVLAIAVLLPVLVFSVIAVLLVLRLERQAAEQQIAEITKRVALSVDRELAKAEASLRAPTQLPLVPPERVPTSAALHAASGTLTGIRVLIIDEDEDTCEMTSAVLKHAGASPVEPVDLVAAVRRLAASGLRQGRSPAPKARPCRARAGRASPPATGRAWRTTRTHALGEEHGEEKEPHTLGAGAGRR